MRLFEPAPSRRFLAPQMMWFSGWLATTSVGAFLHASADGHGTHTQLGLPPCPTALYLGRPCPGCGMTTSWTAFIHGDWQFAFHAHPLGPVAYVAFTFSAMCALWGFFRQERFIIDSREMNWAVGTFAVVFLIFGLVRMAVTTHYTCPSDVTAFANRSATVSK